MQIRQLVPITYEALAKKFKSTTVAAQHCPKGISILHVMPKNGSRLEPDIYAFEYDVLITRDVLLKTKDGGIKHIFTNFYNNGINTVVKEKNEALGKFIRTTYDKTILPLKEIRNKRKGGVAADAMDKMTGKKVDLTIPVTIMKTETKVAGTPAQTTYNVLINGEKDRLRITGNDDSVYLFAKGNGFEKWYDLGAYGKPNKASTINRLVSWFVDANKSLQ